MTAWATGRAAGLHGQHQGRGAGWHPPLDELRLHQSTVWPWNRAIYDPSRPGSAANILTGPDYLDAAAELGVEPWAGGRLAAAPGSGRSADPER